MSRRPRRYNRPMYEYSPPYGGAPSGLRTRQRRNGEGLMWGCLFLSVLMCVGMCVLGVVLTPIAFNNLPAEWQGRVARYLPFLNAFLPTVEPPPLPTLDPARATAAAAFFLPTAEGAPLATLAPYITPSAVLGFAPSPTPVFVISAALQTQTAVAAVPAFRPTATSQPLPSNFYVGRYRREPQQFNNCGPANLIQAMYTLGVEQNQIEVAGWLKPNTADANVSPWQMAQYVNQRTSLRALVRVNGSIDLVKRLIYAGFGVILETGLYHPDDGSWLGHYITINGWDDLGDSQGGFLYGLDTFEENGSDGRGIHEHYADVYERWKHFNRVYLILYRPEQETLLQEILGTAFDETRNYEEGLEKSLQEAQYNPGDVFAYFNVGTNLTALGRFREAAVAYDRAYSTGQGMPWRMLWYQFGPFKAYYEAGDHHRVIALANSVIARTTKVSIEEAFYYRGVASAALGVMDQAKSDLERAAQLNTNFMQAQSALAQLRSGVLPIPEML